MFLASVGWSRPNKISRLSEITFRRPCPIRLPLPVFVYNENGLEEETGFVWDGRYTYIYTDPDNYEPLAQVRDWTTKDGKGVQQAHYCQNGWKS